MTAVEFLPILLAVSVERTTNIRLLSQTSRGGEGKTYCHDLVCFWKNISVFMLAGVRR